MMISTWFKKIMLVALTAALSLSGLPLTQVYAAGLSDTSTPPAPTQLSADKIQKLWQREQNAYTRLGRFFGNADQFLTSAQKRIDKAKARGLDVTDLQAALDSVSAAVKQARPFYNSVGELISAHQGFDSQGNVTDTALATQTLKDVHTQFKQIRDLIGNPLKVLRDAFRAFRDAHHPTPTPTGTSS